MSCSRLHRQMSRCEVPALRVRASLRVAGFGESSVSRVDSGKYPQGDRPLGSYPQRWRAEPTVDLSSALRQGRVHTDARRMYYAPGIPCLARKRDKAVRFLAPLGYASARSVGRPRVGWLYTVPASGE